MKCRNNFFNVNNTDLYAKGRKSQIAVQELLKSKEYDG